jgi:hypothetical protein
LNRGELQLAEADFHESIGAARSMNASSLELRRTMSLTRLLASNGKRNEARTMLAETRISALNALGERHRRKM